jgi:hypothetical protein
LTYVGDRADTRALEQLEAILRVVTEELAGWRARALQAESNLKDAHPRSGTGAAQRHEPEQRARVTDLESENRALRMRVEAARARVADLLTRLSFLEEQAGAAAAAGTAK